MFAMHTIMFSEKARKTHTNNVRFLKLTLKNVINHPKTWLNSKLFESTLSRLVNCFLLNKYKADSV